MEDKFDWSEFESDVVRFERVGDGVAGTIIGFDKRVGRGDKKVPIIFFEVAGGTRRTLWVGPYNLYRQLKKIDPQLGDCLEIEFIAEQQTGQASPAKIFRVEHRPAAGDDDLGEEPF
jgi:hypothetical protein